MYKQKRISFKNITLILKKKDNCLLNINTNQIQHLLVKIFLNERMADWKEDERLKYDLEKYVLQGIQRKEILDYMYRDFKIYTWSLRTLDRRLRYFEIYYIDLSTTLEDVKSSVQKELDGPGIKLGYRAMRLKVRQKYELKVSRDNIHNVMYDLAPEVLEERQPFLKKKKPRGNFVSKGPNWVLSLDGHDKLMGYQNSTFPIAIYGCIDTASRKLLWLRVWDTNSKPELIGRWYLEYLYESRSLPAYLRIDKGTETGIMATMHAFLRQEHNDIEDPCDSVLYGPSTSNQVRTS